MDLELTDEQRELRDVARSMLTTEPRFAYARARTDGEPAAAEAIGRMVELGWYGVGLDPDDPFGLPGLCLLAEQIGAGLAPSPLADVAIAARVATAAGEDEVAAGLIAGEPSVALAWLDADGDWALDAISATASPDGDGHAITGTKVAVRHGAAAEAFAVVADVDGEPGLFMVGADTAGVSVAEDRGIDPSLAPASVSFDAAAASTAMVGADAAAALERGLLLGAVATAAEATGAAETALELAVAYALERKQFGRPIGSFQAVQHILADVHILIESSWATCFYAAAALDEELAEGEEAAAIATAHASRSTREAVEGAMQAFGGVAFTWEHHLHLLLRRVLECERRFGDSIHHERVLAEGLARRARGGHEVGV